MLIMLTCGHRSLSVFHLIGSVSPGTFVSRDSMVNMCNRKFSHLGVGWATCGRAWAYFHGRWYAWTKEDVYCLEKWDQTARPR